MGVNYTPTLGEYTDLKPFRFWCQKVLPLVYDDSLSYYEVICKCIDYLNITMEDVNTSIKDVENLHEAYDLLQTYVNDYFDNLDVQNEIDDKLDRLVEDGTIHDIFTDDVTAVINQGVEARNAAIAAIPQNVTNWLNENIEVGTGYVIDKTLTVENAAADAKAAGDAISDLKSDLNNVAEAISYKVAVSPTYVSHSLIRSTGALSTSTLFNMYTINIDGVNKIGIKSRNNSNRATYLMAFYSSDTVIDETTCLSVEHYMPEGVETEYTEEFYVPNGAIAVRMVCDTNFSMEVTAIYFDPLMNGVEKKQTIYSESATPTYLGHRYLNNYGVPSTATSNAWTLYKLDVSECDTIEIVTYRTGTADSSTSLPLYSIVSTDFANVTLTSENSSTLVKIGELIEPTDNAVNLKISIPDDGNTMFIVVKAANENDLSIKAYHYNDFQQLKELNSLLSSDYSLSPYYRNIQWGCQSFGTYYHSVDSGTTDFISTTTASQYFEKFNNLVASYGDYAESHAMGIASDGLTNMYYYTFNPLTNQESQTFQQPKIIVSAGQHGFEKTANFGIYYFVEDLLKNWENNSYLAYVRNHVKLVIMPMLNPYGFDHDTYTNANGVNLNRNWDTQAWSKGTQGTTTYGGEAPLDQPETQYASTVILNNLDALWLCDYHNNGQVAPSSARSYLWHSFGLVTYKDNYFAKGIEAAKWHIDEITGHLYVDYPEQCNYEVSGIFTDNNAPSHQGLITAYAREHNIMAATMEGGAAFIGSGNRYSSSIQHMNADLLGNWIRCLLATFEHYSVK